MEEDLLAPRDDWPRIIEVVRTALPSGGAPAGTFEFRERGARIDPDLSFSKVGMKTNEDHTIVFEVQDLAGTGLHFHPTPATAMWVATGSQTKPPPCPTNVSSDTKQQIIPQKVSDDRKRLKARNRNDEAWYFAFRLNFVAANDKTANPALVDYCDPIIQNQNGGNP